MADNISLDPELQKIHDRIATKKEKHKAKNPGKRFQWTEAEMKKAIQFLESNKYPTSHVAKAFCTNPVAVKGWAGIKPKKQEQAAIVHKELMSSVTNIKKFLKKCTTQEELAREKDYLLGSAMHSIEQVIKNRSVEIKQTEVERKEREAVKARKAKEQELKEAEKRVAQLKAELAKKPRKRKAQSIPPE